MAYKDKGLIKVVSGLRRSGKSTLLELYRQTLLQIGVKDKQIVFLNFEEFELRKFLNDFIRLPGKWRVKAQLNESLVHK